MLVCAYFSPFHCNTFFPWQELEERIEEQERDAENLDADKGKLNDKIDGLKKDIEGLEDNLKKVRNEVF